MKRETYTVRTGFTDLSGRHWVYVSGYPRPLLCDKPIPEGTAVVLKDGRAVRASS